MSIGDWSSDVCSSDLEPDSVIDFGCGLGRYLTGFQAHDVTVQGVEGYSEARDHVEIPTDALTIRDLREPLELDDGYELALCIETAEHIPSRFADTLVETVTAAAPRGTEGEIGRASCRERVSIDV